MSSIIQRNTSSIFSLVAAWFVTLCGAWLGLATALGAHPAWALKVALIGAATGSVLCLLLSWLRVPHKARWIAFILLFVLAAICADIGKTRFALSYAEDHAAGKMWFFGWMAVMCGFFGLVNELSGFLLTRKTQH